MTIRPAREEDAEVVTTLAIRSKAVWGYDEQMMAVFRDELSVDGVTLVEMDGHVAERDGEIVGFYTLLPRSPEVTELEHLFVTPEALREGVGSALLAHAVQRMRDRKVLTMRIISDPNSVGFYERQGALQVGMHDSADIPGRSIPILELAL